MRARILATLSLFLLLAPSVVTAQDGGIETRVSALADGVSIQDANLTPGQQIQILVNVSVPEKNNTEWRAFVNGSLEGAPIEALPDGAIAIENGGYTRVAASTQAPNTTGPATLASNLTVQYRSVDTNATQGNESANWTTAQGFPHVDAFAFQVQELTIEPGPGLPWGWILGVGALAAVGVGGVYWWTTRDRQIRGTARSQAMQDLESDQFEEQAPDEPEVHPQAKILEARAEDIQRMIVLAKERHERGDLTEHQYETIRERKQAELDEVEAKIEEYRSDAGSSG